MGDEEDEEEKQARPVEEEPALDDQEPVEEIDVVEPAVEKIELGLEDEEIQEPEILSSDDEGDYGDMPAEFYHSDVLERQEQEEQQRKEEEALQLEQFENERKLKLSTLAQQREQE